MTTNTEPNKVLARQWFDSATYRDRLSRAEETGNPKTAREKFFRSLIAEVFAPDCIMHFPDGDGDFDRILRYHLVMMDAFPDLSFSVEDLIAEEEKVVVRGKMKGTNTGPFNALPPTGNSVTMGFITIARVQAGKIVETWGYNDMAGFTRQLGNSP
jgi:predicted ester cyclase